MFSMRTKVVLGVLAVVVAGYAVTRFINGTSAEPVPADFTAARLQGALIAQTVVDLSRESARGLETIGTLDREWKFGEAIDATAQVLLKSREIRDRAAELAREIEKMTIALSGVESVEARQAALEAVSNRLALITRLINYSASLGQLLEILEDRFRGSATITSAQVQLVLDQINAEVDAINTFNEQANSAMDRFDRFVER